MQVEFHRWTIRVDTMYCTHTVYMYAYMYVCTYVHVPSMWLVGCQLRFLVELLHLSLHMCHMHGNAHTYIHRVCLVVTI